MGCLSDISKPVIGIREDCSEITPSSGCYINDLEGITLEFADGIVSTDDKNGVDLLQKKIKLAEKVIVNDISLQLAQHIKQDTLIDFDSIGIAKDNLVPIASKPAYLKGIKLQIEESSYIDFHLHQVALWLDDAVTTNVEVWDLVSGVKLQDIEVTTVSNEITYVQIDSTFKTRKNNFHIAILYDSGVAGTFNTTIHDNICQDCRRTSGFVNHFMHVSGVEIASAKVKTANNFDSASGTSGLFIDYSVKCSAENFLCNNSNSFALPLLYKTGELVVREAVFSKRLNKYVTIDSELNKDLEADFKQMYKDSVNGVVQRMRVPKNDICFRCDPIIARRIEIPK